VVDMTKTKVSLTSSGDTITIVIHSDF
jgi:hypothetical protein